MGEAESTYFNEQSQLTSSKPDIREDVGYRQESNDSLATPKRIIPETESATRTPQEEVTHTEQKEDKPNTNTFNSDTPIEEKISIIEDSRVLHDPQLYARPLKLLPLEEVSGVQVYTCPGAEFELHPNKKYLEKLEAIKPEDNGITRMFKLLKVAGTDSALWSIIIKGIGTGLSHGTMDLIYRIGVGDRVPEVLDNLDIAVGSLQRRIIAADTISTVIKEKNIKNLYSIAGGSCLIPIEGIYQSNQHGVVITNVDRSPKANEKAIKTLEDINNMRNIGLSLKFEERDILKNGLDLPNTQEPRLIECTGFWEYLDTNQREALLEKVSKSMGSNDIFVLTALVKNDQQNIFNALKFKKLSPHPLEDLILEVKEHFGNLEKTIVTPNGTYATIVIRK